MDLLVENIKTLPPQLMEEVIGTTKASIKKDSKDKYKNKYMKKYKQQIENELGENIQDMIKDLTSIIQRSRETNETWIKPVKWDHIPEEIFQRCVNITNDFIDMYHQPNWDELPRNVLEMPGNTFLGRWWNDTEISDDDTD